MHKHRAGVYFASTRHRNGRQQRDNYTRGTRNAATVACERYGVGGTRSIASRDATEDEILFSFETNMEFFLRSNCTSTEQEYILLQPDIEMDDNNETTTQQAAAREEFARPTKKRQQQGMTMWSTDQNMQFDRGRSRVNSLLS